MPALRVAYAGNSACRSSVQVNQMLMRSSALNALRSRTASIISTVAEMISSRSSASTWIAPRTARTATSSQISGTRTLRRRLQKPAEEPAFDGFARFAGQALVCSPDCCPRETRRASDMRRARVLGAAAALLLIPAAVGCASPGAPTIVLDPGHSGTSLMLVDPATRLTDYDYPNNPEM